MCFTFPGANFSMKMFRLGLSDCLLAHFGVSCLNLGSSLSLRRGEILTPSCSGRFEVSLHVVEEMLTPSPD